MKQGGDNKTKLVAWIAGLGLLGAIVAVDFTAHHHAHFERDGITADGANGFFPMFGLACGLGLVIVAKVLAVALKRKDTFYADD